MKRVKTALVPLVLWYFRTLARLALSQTHATIIGIAGAVGKTSTREALFAILRDIAPTHMVAGNSETGVPLGLVGLFPHDYSPVDWLRMVVAAPLRIGFLRHMRYVIVEMGIDDPYPPKNMDYLLTIVRPHIGVITNESAAHTMQFEKLFTMPVSDTERLKLLVEAITKEDAKMVRAADIGIVNGDNPYLTRELPDAVRFGKPFGYRVSADRTSFEFDGIPVVFKGYAFPQEMGYVFAAALSVADKLNIPADTAADLLQKNFVPPKSRESVFAGIKNSIIIDSSYNASRPSVISFLELTAALKKKTRRHTIIVLADMLELGNEARIEHDAVARAIDKIPDELYLVGPLTRRFILPKFPAAKWFPSVIELNDALTHIPQRSLILFKGSQGELWLEECIKLLLKNTSDVSRLCRQNAFWKKVKLAAGKWVTV